MGYKTLPLEEDMLDWSAGPLLLGIVDNVDIYNDSVDDIGSFVTRTDSTIPINKSITIKLSMQL